MFVLYGAYSMICLIVSIVLHSVYSILYSVLCGSYSIRDCILSSTWFLLYAVFYIIHCYVHVLMYTLNALFFPRNGG